MALLVHQALNSLNAALQNGDSKSFRELYTPDGRFVGTDDSEQWDVDQTCAQLDTTNGKGLQLQLVRRDIFLKTINIWAFYELLHHPKYGHMRATGLCMQSITDGVVRVAEYNLSYLISDKAVVSVRVGTMLELISDQPN